MDEARDLAFGSMTSEVLIEQLRESGGANGDPDKAAALREDIVRRNIGLVKSIAAQFVHSGELLDDLIQAGHIGLLNAVANFDLAKGTRFSTYATHLIRGEIRHYIRDKHTTIRIPQWVQTMNRRLKQAEEAVFQEKGRPPTLDELGSHLGLSADQVAALLRGRQSMTYVSIDRQRRETDPNPAPPTIEHLMRPPNSLPQDVRMRILVAIEQLSAIQQQVIEGLFFDGKSQSEVGDELGISQRQVSRMKNRILEQMRETLKGKSEPEN